MLIDIFKENKSRRIRRIRITCASGSVRRGSQINFKFSGKSLRKGYLNIDVKEVRE